ncbi:MAG: nucleotidyltransferase domain-containing protein [Candidatus Bathyarchaeia archaeon]
MSSVLPADLPSKVKEAIDDLKRMANKLGIREAYLSGSYARGDWLYESDLDLIIISDIFEGKHIGERFWIVKKLFKTQISLDLLAYTSKEFDEAKGRSIILQDMLKYAIRII